MSSIRGKKKLMANKFRQSIMACRARATSIKRKIGKHRQKNAEIIEVVFGTIIGSVFATLGIYVLNNQALGLLGAILGSYVGFKIGNFLISKSFTKKLDKFLSCVKI